jgi:hypothetical protein
LRGASLQAGIVIPLFEKLFVLIAVCASQSKLSNELLKRALKKLCQIDMEVMTKLSILP